MKPCHALSLTGWWLLSGLLTLGCAASEEAAVPEEPAAAATELLGEDGPVRVDLSEYMIDMPAVLPAGETVLSVSNLGIEDHNLRITRAGAEAPMWVMAGNLSPGRTEVVTLDLAAGTYLVLCDFAGHDTRGMFIEVEVRAGRP